MDTINKVSELKIKILLAKEGEEIQAIDGIDDSLWDFVMRGKGL